MDIEAVRGGLEDALRRFYAALHAAGASMETAALIVEPIALYTADIFVLCDRLKEEGS